MKLTETTSFVYETNYSKTKYMYRTEGLLYFSHTHTHKNGTLDLFNFSLSVCTKNTKKLDRGTFYNDMYCLPLDKISSKFNNNKIISVHKLSGFILKLFLVVHPSLQEGKSKN